MTAVSIGPRAVAGLPVHRPRPIYEAVVHRAMARLWRSSQGHVLDIGTGNGTLARFVYTQMPAGQVTAIDVTERDPDWGARTFDGRRLPFVDGTFAAATLNEVVARVPPGERVALLREIRRTTRGPLYIKDRETRRFGDRLRIAALGGGVTARPLTMAEWHALAEASGWRIAAKVRGFYRRGWAARLCPNRLELAMRWER